MALATVATAGPAVGRTHSDDGFCFMCALEANAIVLNMENIPPQLRAQHIERFSEDPGEMLIAFNNKAEECILQGFRMNTIAKSLVTEYNSLRQFIEYKHPQRANVQTGPAWSVTCAENHVYTSPRNANTVGAPLDQIYTGVLRLTQRLEPREDNDVFGDGYERVRNYLASAKMCVQLAQSIAVLDRNKEPIKQRQTRLTFGGPSRSSLSSSSSRPRAIKSVD